jgi:PKD repeat protein
MPAVAYDKTFTLAGQSSLTGDVYAGDDPDSFQDDVVELVQDVVNGTLALDQFGFFTYTANAPGVFTDVFTYHLKDAGGAYSNTAHVYLTGIGPQPPTVGFRATAPRFDPTGPLSVSFTGYISVPSPDSYLWEFGDGSLAAVSNPTKVFSEIGVYDITLTGWYAGVPYSLTKHNYVQIGSTSDHPYHPSGIPLYVKGTLVAESGLPLYLRGRDGATGSAPLFVRGIGAPASGCSLFASGSRGTVVRGQTTLDTAGRDTASSGVPLLLGGKLPASGQTTLYTNGVYGASHGLNLAVCAAFNGVPDSGSTPLYVRGRGAASGMEGARDLYLFSDDSGNIPEGRLTLALLGASSARTTRNVNLFTAGCLRSAAGATPLLTANTQSGSAAGTPLLVAGDGVTDGALGVGTGINLVLVRNPAAAASLLLRGPGDTASSGTPFCATGAAASATGLPLVVPATLGPGSSGVKLYTNGW